MLEGAVVFALVKDTTSHTVVRADTHLIVVVDTVICGYVGGGDAFVIAVVVEAALDQILDVALLFGFLELMDNKECDVVVPVIHCLWHNHLSFVAVVHHQSLQSDILLHHLIHV